MYDVHLIPSQLHIGPIFIDTVSACVHPSWFAR